MTPTGRVEFRDSAQRCMTKPLKSQWDFGELFAPEAVRRVWTVGELTATVKRLLEREVGRVWVTGEITNWRVQNSGHAYFSLKDTVAQLSCVLFRAEAAGVNRSLLRDGQKVVLHGDLTVYEARGQYQLRVTAIELQGIGALHVAFEQLKNKLNAEGLFASGRKRPLPRFLRRIGVVTSPTGAALRDVLHVIERRNPLLQIILAPCRVQGQGAAAEIAAAIGLLNAWAAEEPLPGESLPSPAPDIRTMDSSSSSSSSSPSSSGRGKIEDEGETEGDGCFDAASVPGRQKDSRLDAILVTRGGGSLEDLWAFNEEAVARAIFDARVPVVSAVGHEIDFTIADFVADVRAATPSVAAEIMTEGVFSSREFIASAPAQLRETIRERLTTERTSLDGLRECLSRTHPRHRLEEHSQRLDDLQATLSRFILFGIRERRNAWQAIAQRLLRVRPSMLTQRQREGLSQLRSRLCQTAKVQVDSLHARLQNSEGRLRLLAPDHVLSRGYSITLDASSGKAIRSAGEVRAGQHLRTRLKSGEILSTADE